MAKPSKTTAILPRFDCAGAGSHHHGWLDRRNEARYDCGKLPHLASSDRKGRFGLLERFFLIKKMGYLMSKNHEAGNPLRRLQTPSSCFDGCTACSWSWCVGRWSGVSKRIAGSPRPGVFSGGRL